VGGTAGAVSARGFKFYWGEDHNPSVSEGEKKKGEKIRGGPGKSSKNRKFERPGKPPAGSRPSRGTGFKWPTGGAVGSGFKTSGFSGSESTGGLGDA